VGVEALPRHRPQVTRARDPAGDCQIAVRLQPRARTTEILGERGGVLVVRVSAPPVEGRANDALCRLIAKQAGVGVRRVSILRGAGAREKVVRIEGVDPEQLSAPLRSAVRGARS
jgi:uncharacterized protein (TIGR00251 family)